MPQDLIWFWKSSAMKSLPWSWRSARPRAASAAEVAELLADRHADGLERPRSGCRACSRASRAASAFQCSATPNSQTLPSLRRW